MRFIIYCPGMPITPEVMQNGSLGGSESSGFYLSRELVRQGHEVLLFTNTQNESFFDGVPLLPIGQVSDKYPQGQNFQEKAITIPHDVMLFQRDPRGMSFRPNAKLVFFWAHDLGRKRNRGAFHNNGFRFDGIMAVTEFHANQLVESLGVPRDKIFVLRNAPDLDLFKDEPNPERKHRGKKIAYISRPERGLENLIKPDGIMEKLQEVDPEIMLCVAHYDNTTPQTAKKYAELWARCNELPNVALMGALSKKGVADLMYDSAALCYPVLNPSEFEETSCIALMEAQAAGSLIISGNAGAIPETLGWNEGMGDNWRSLINFSDDGSPNVDEFVTAILKLFRSPQSEYTFQSMEARKYALERYQWEKTVEALLTDLDGLLHVRCKSASRLLNHFLDTSDYTAARRLLDSEEDFKPNAKQQKELDLYSFLHTGGTYQKHYARSAQLMVDYTDEATRYAVQNHLGGHLDQYVAPHVVALANRGGGKVLDYGCGLGHIMLTLAAKYPMLKFVGADIAKTNVDLANAEAKRRGLNNLKFRVAKTPSDLNTKFDLTICLETVEHVREDANVFFAELEKITNSGRRVIVAFPSGPPEPYVRKPGEEERMEHVRFIEHFEIKSMLGKKQGLSENYFHRGTLSKDEAPVGGCVVSWMADGQPLGDYAWEQKRWEQAPRETLSVCMIVRAETLTLEKTLYSVKDIADQIIIRIDAGEDADAFNMEACSAYRVGKKYGAEMLCGLSPTVIGFAEARNESIKNVTSDWILWIDDDETLVWPERLLKYLKPSFYDAYSIHHHHFSCEPAGLMKTDLPTRLFRSDRGFTFYGLVHEHPEIGEMNNGPGNVSLIPPNQSAIMHVGYESENVRRKRFERNWPLMLKDHKEHPERKLGRMLYLRDLVHKIRFELEQNIDNPVGRHEIIDEGIDLWRAMLKNKDIRFAAESVSFISELVQYDQRKPGIIAKFGFEVNYQGAGINPDPNVPLPFTTGLFPTSEDLILFTNALINDKVGVTTTKYF